MHRGRYRALGEPQGIIFPFLDSDVYKWLEAVGWELGRAPDPALVACRRRGDRARRGGAAAGRVSQHATSRSSAAGSEYEDLAVGPRAVLRRPPDPGGRRLASRGRRRPAARDRGSRSRLRRARAGPGRRGPGSTAIRRSRWRSSSCSGSPASAATSTLRRASSTGRGHGLLGNGRFGAAYWQDHAPVRDAPTVAGPRRAPAVPRLRRGRRRGGARRRRSCSTPSSRRWRDMVATRMYLTGGLGSRHRRRGVRRPVRAAAGSGLRRDVRRDRRA